MHLNLNGCRGLYMKPLQRLTQLQSLLLGQISMLPLPYNGEITDYDCSDEELDRHAGDDGITSEHVENNLIFTAFTSLLDLDLRYRKINKLSLAPYTLTSLNLTECRTLEDDSLTASELGALIKININNTYINVAIFVPLLPHTLVHLGVGDVIGLRDDVFTIICNCMYTIFSLVCAA